VRGLKWGKVGCEYGSKLGLGAYETICNKKKRKKVGNGGLHHNEKKVSLGKGRGGIMKKRA